MPKAVYRECGAVYYGWALKHGDNRCERCGGNLVEIPETRGSYGTAQGR